MTEVSDNSKETVDRLRLELEELQRQHEQYTLALDAAVDARASLRLQRTLELLDEEIEGLEEALKGYEDGQPEPASDGGSGHAILPDAGWDEDEEPATSIYSADDGGVGPVYGDQPIHSPGRAMHSPLVQPGPIEYKQPAGDDEDPETVSLQAPWQEGPPTDPVRAAENADVDPPTMSVTPPVEEPPLPGSSQVDALMSDVVTPSGGMRPGADPPVRRERPAAPPGGASFSSLPPPADAEWGHTEIVPPEYETVQMPAKSLPPPASPVVQQQAAPPPAAPPLSSASPFGGPAATPDPMSYNTGSYDAVDKDGEWSMGSRILLILVVLAFLGGVGYILSQGP